MKRPVLASLAAAALCLTASASAGAAALSLFAEPQAGAQPVIELLAGARKSIEMTMYELRDPRVERALVAAGDRGVDVRVLLNRNDPFEATSPNAPAYSYLRSHGVAVRYAPSYLSLTHQKTVTVDGRVSVIMSLNLDAGYGSTRDFGVIDTQPSDVRAITAVFNADWTGHRITPSAGTGDLVWSPGAGNAFVAAIDAAKHSIDVESEEMDYRPATHALCDAAGRGVGVRVVMTYAPEWRSAVRQLSGCGVHVHLFHGQAYYIHAKLLEVDGTLAIVGSTNLSAESLWYNRELSIALTGPPLIAQLSRWFDSDYARAVRRGHSGRRTGTPAAAR